MYFHTLQGPQPHPIHSSNNRLSGIGSCTRAYFEDKPWGPSPLWVVRETTQTQMGTAFSVFMWSCERTSPHHIIHQLTARTTVMTTCSIATTVAPTTCSIATAIALSNRQVTWAGHTLTALTLPHPQLLSLQTGLPQLGGKNSTFRWTFWFPHSPFTHTKSQISCLD